MCQEIQQNNTTTKPLKQSNETVESDIQIQRSKGMAAWIHGYVWI